MKAFLIGSALAALSATVAIAQSAPPTPPGVAQGTSPLPPRAPMAARSISQQQMHVKIMSDRVMTRDEVVAHVKKLFERLDTNHDGYVTREEANAMFRGMGELHEHMEGMRQHMDGMRDHMEKMRFNVQYDGAPAHGDPGAMFDKLDTNHDGVISREEFMNGRAQMREKRVIVMRSPDGAAPMPPMPPMREMRMHAMAPGMGFAGRLFDMADANHDGRVSLQEAETAALAHFDKADLNHDGRITPDERQKVRMIQIEHPTS